MWHVLLFKQGYTIHKLNKLSTYFGDRISYFAPTIKVGKKIKYSTNGNLYIKTTYSDDLEQELISKLHNVCFLRNSEGIPITIDNDYIERLRSESENSIVEKPRNEHIIGTLYTIKNGPLKNFTGIFSGYKKNKPHLMIYYGNSFINLPIFLDNISDNISEKTEDFI